MEERLARSIRTRASLKDLAQLEANIQQRGLLTSDVVAALNDRSTELARSLVAERAGIDLTDLTPAEEKIVQAASEYIGVKKRSGANANRTLTQLKDKGLIGAAEAAVSRSKPTIGFQTLSDVGLSELSYEQIIVDHPHEFTDYAIWHARRRLDLPNNLPKAPAQTVSRVYEQTVTLLTWLKALRAPDGRIPAFSNQDAASAIGLGDLKSFGRVFGNIQSRVDFACYRARVPPLGLTAIAPFDRAWEQKDRSWAFPVSTMQAAAQSRLWVDDDFIAVTSEAGGLPGRAYVSWQNEMAEHQASVRAWAFGRSVNNTDASLDGAAPESVETPTEVQPQAADTTGTAPYWVFVCNPKKWAIDRFLDRHIEQDSWGVRPSDSEHFAPGQLGIVRVGVDRRTSADRDGAPPLEAGVYAICEVESAAFAATGASDEFWADDAPRQPGWPTVRLRYLKTFLRQPLTIDRMRSEAPELSSLLLNGFQAASFQISSADFHRVMELFGEDLDLLETSDRHSSRNSTDLAVAEERYLKASPEVKERVSRFIERGPVGSWAKEQNGYRCQLCDALGLAATGFKKRDGQSYVEAHHVMPVASGQIGSLALSNIMTVCANHHRQLHYGLVSVAIVDRTFEIEIDKVRVSIPRLGALGK
jgi:hypothetical protein